MSKKNKKVTNLTLLEFIFRQMELLDSGKINSDTARSQAQLAKQANSAMRFGIEKTDLKLRVDYHNHVFGTKYKPNI